MIFIHTKRMILLGLCLAGFTATCFSQALSCADLKNGVFIYFSKTDGTKSVYTRSGAGQKEFDASTRETVFWDVEWISDCSYTLKYVSGMDSKPKQVMETLNKHKILFRITSVAEEYYTFESFLDKPSNPLLLKDTLWIKQRKDAKNKTFPNPHIDSLLALKKTAYEASLARSATLYIFRPGKFVESLAVCTIYYNDTAICTMTNKSAYVVRLLKEGPATFSARIGKQEMNVKLDVVYGNNYFLRCELKWAIPAKPIFTKSDLAEAKPYFENVKIK